MSTYKKRVIQVASSDEEEEEQPLVSSDSTRILKSFFIWKK